MRQIGTLALILEQKFSGPAKTRLEMSRSLSKRKSSDVSLIFGHILATKYELVSGSHAFSMALIPFPSRCHNVLQ
jgi:hypothetical protein